MNRLLTLTLSSVEEEREEQVRPLEQRSRVTAETETVVNLNYSGASSVGLAGGVGDPALAGSAEACASSDDRWVAELEATSEGCSQSRTSLERASSCRWKSLLTDKSDASGCAFHNVTNAGRTNWPWKL